MGQGACTSTVCWRARYNPKTCRDDLRRPTQTVSTSTIVALERKQRELTRAQEELAAIRHAETVALADQKRRVIFA
jgi:hypothetical protein